MKRQKGQVAQSRVVTPTLNEVPPERFVIDRVLRSMLERDGTDLHGIAEALICRGYDSIEGGVKYAWVEVGDDVYELIQEGLDPPVMSAWVPLGNACYRGDYLYVRELLPQTICASAAGLRLGDVVSTGIPQLDDRTLLQVVTCEEQWRATPGTRFVFAPDLVELGPRLASMPGGPNA